MQYAFGISVLLLILQLVSYAKNELEKAEKLRKMESELSESRISIMLSQIRPHFLYNSLVGIKQLCDTEPTKASDALEHFAYYLRGNLYSLSQPNLVQFHREMELVKDYLFLEKMRFDERIHIVWEIKITEFLIPSLTLQTIVENAVNHGITKKEAGGTIWITTEKEGDAVIVTVKDDGRGFDVNAKQEDDQPHIGLNNVRRRIEIQCGGRLEVQSQPGEGTVVKIILPLE